VVLVAPAGIGDQARAVEPLGRAGFQERTRGELADADDSHHVVAEVVPGVEQPRHQLGGLRVGLEVQEIDPDAVGHLPFVEERAHRVMRPVAIEVRCPVRVVARRGKAALVEMRGHADAGGVAHRVLQALQHRVARLQLAQLEQRHRAGRRARECASVDGAGIADNADRDALADEEIFAKLIG